MRDPTIADIMDETFDKEMIQYDRRKILSQGDSKKVRFIRRSSMLNSQKELANMKFEQMEEKVKQ